LSDERQETLVGRSPKSHARSVMKFTFLALFALFATVSVASAEWLPLWPGEAPGGTKPVTLTEDIGKGGRLTDITVPQYDVRLPAPAKRTGAAVIILPGGGYSILAMSHEGREYADWLVQRGIAAVIVKYRVSRKAEAGYQFPVPLMDARRAIRLTRSKAKEWGIDPAKVGVMGSSAGGHLAAMCTTLWDEKLPQETTDAIDALNCRPDFAVLVYPVISTTETWGHGGSKRRLIGENPPAELELRVSAERRVNANTPPCFLIHAADDPVVPVRNSLEFAARCAENKVPVVCHVFAKGSHGFGLKGSGDSIGWPSLLETWLQSQIHATP
jgi:acetyl esterase/lipase